MNDHLKALLQNQYLMLEDLLQNVNKNSLAIKPANGKWSVFENIAHLGRYNEIFLIRLQEMLHTNNPFFERYVADNEPGFIEWCSKSFDWVFTNYRSSRETVVKYFESLSDDELKRIGTHPKFGKLKINEWLHFYLLHEAHHLFTIFRLVHSGE